MDNTCIKQSVKKKIVCLDYFLAKKDGPKAAEVRKADFVGLFQDFEFAGVQAADEAVGQFFMGSHIEEHDHIDMQMLLLIYEPGRFHGRLDQFHFLPVEGLLPKNGLHVHEEPFIVKVKREIALLGQGGNKENFALFGA
jgi:hypothetical protein